MTTFAVPEVEIPIEDVGIRRLAAELDALATTRFGQSATSLAGEIRDSDRVEVEAMPVRQFWPFLRALDHVRNAGTATPGLRRLRDGLVAGGLTYTVVAVGGKGETFFSYSGTYEKGDRLVASAEDIVRVVRADTTCDPTLLTVQPW